MGLGVHCLRLHPFPHLATELNDAQRRPHGRCLRRCSGFSWPCRARSRVFSKREVPKKKLLILKKICLSRGSPRGFFRIVEPLSLPKISSQKQNASPSPPDFLWSKHPILPTLAILGICHVQSLRSLRSLRGPAVPCLKIPNQT